MKYFSIYTPHEENKKAYRSLCKQYHPDRNPGNKETEEKFKDIAVQWAEYEKRFKLFNEQKQFTKEQTKDTNAQNGSYQVRYDIPDEKWYELLKMIDPELEKLIRRNKSKKEDKSKKSGGLFWDIFKSIF